MDVQRGVVGHSAREKFISLRKISGKSVSIKLVSIVIDSPSDLKSKVIYFLILSIHGPLKPNKFTNLCPIKTPPTQIK